MEPEKKKKKRGGAHLQKEESVTPKEPGQVKKRPKPKRTRSQKILRALYITITVIAALIVAGFIGWNLFSAPPDASGLPSTTRKPQVTKYLDENGEEVEVEIPGLSADRKEQFYTFLLVGRDTGGGGLTDTMMLGAYDVPNQKLSVMSIPRDTYVKYSGRTMLINAVYNSAGGGEKGIEALKEEIGKLTGVIPDYHVILEWEAVGELAEAIGGVWFEVPWDMNYDDPKQNLHIHVNKGYQCLDKNDVMGVVRWRQNNDKSHSSLGDIGRIQIQQDFMKAVIQQCLQPNVLLPNLTEYIRIFQENVETNLSVSNMAYFAKSAIGSLDMENIEFVTLPYKSAGDQHLLPAASQIVEVINESFNPYKEDIQLSELDVVTSVASSSGNRKPSATATPTDPPEVSDDPEVTDDPGTTEDPGVTEPPVEVTEDPGMTEEPPVSQEPEETPPAETGLQVEEPDVPVLPPWNEAAETAA